MPTTNGKEQVFNFGIKNNDPRPADTTADFLVTQNIDNTQGKIDPALLPVSESVQNLLNLKLNIADYNEYFKGKYSSLIALQTAYPAANDGDYAIVDIGSGTDAVEYIWDTDEGWVQGGSAGASTTDALPEGSTNLYFTTARVLATLLTGISFVTGGAITATDSILIAFGKIQKQISDALVSIGLKQDVLVSGTNIKTVNYENLLGSGNLPIQFMNASSIEAFGDSITVGQNSSPATNSYVNLIGTLYSKTVTNRALSGSGIWNAAKSHFANITSSSTVLAIVMAGFNDVRRGGANAKTTAKIINGYKSIIANHFLNSFTPAGTVTASITRSGTWNNYTGISVGVKTNLGSYSNINGNYIEYSFTDNNIVIGLVAGDGVSQIHADFNVTLDGVSQGSFTENNQTDGISDGVNDNARSAMCLFFTGLSEGTHTIRLTNTTSSSRNLIVDYFGHLKQPKFCYPVVVMKAPKMDATGYAISPNLASDAIIDQLNSDLVSMVASFPENYPIVVADTNSYYDVTTGLDTDHIHPNNLGHRQIYEAAYNATKPLLLSGASADYIFNSGGVNRSNRLFPNSTVDNDANITAYPNIGTNVSSSIAVIPRGTGLNASIKAQLGIYSTDYIANPTNYEICVLRAGATYFSLVSGKGGTGTIRPILLSSGFADGSTNSNQMWIMPSGNVLLGTGTDNATDKVQVAGTLLVSSTVKAGATIRLKNYTVATLPTGVQGDTAYVTDATAPTYLGTLTGGGSVVCPVFYNGTAWVSH